MQVIYKNFAFHVFGFKHDLRPLQQAALLLAASASIYCTTPCKPSNRPPPGLAWCPAPASRARVLPATHAAAISPSPLSDGLIDISCPQGLIIRPVTGNRRPPIPVYRSGLAGYQSKQIKFKFEFKLSSSTGSYRYTGRFDR